MPEQFSPDWELGEVDKLAVLLTIALNKYIPNWPGATDEQLADVARAIIEARRDG